MNFCIQYLMTPAKEDKSLRRLRKSADRNDDLLRAIVLGLPIPQR